MHTCKLELAQENNCVVNVCVGSYFLVCQTVMISCRSSNNGLSETHYGRIVKSTENFEQGEKVKKIENSTLLGDCKL